MKTDMPQHSSFTLHTFFEKFDQFGDAPDAVAERRLGTAWRSAPEERNVYRNAGIKQSKLRRSDISTHDEPFCAGELMDTQEHAAPLGLVIDGETLGYKQAAPTELWTRAEEARV